MRLDAKSALALPCCRRIDPPQLPTQSIEWCGVVWAVHLALCNGRARGEVLRQKMQPEWSSPAA
jgi:hypothetical protein